MSSTSIYTTYTVSLDSSLLGSCTVILSSPCFCPASPSRFHSSSFIILSELRALQIFCRKNWEWVFSGLAWLWPGSSLLCQRRPSMAMEAVDGLMLMPLSMGAVMLPGPWVLTYSLNLSALILLQ